MSSQTPEEGVEEVEQAEQGRQADADQDVADAPEQHGEEEDEGES